VAGLGARPRRSTPDRGYAHDSYRRRLRQRRVRPVIARRGIPHGSGSGTVRWGVERTLAWLHARKRLAIGWEYHADMHETLIKLACCLTC
jgi:hypothetical protein